MSCVIGLCIFSNTHMYTHTKAHPASWRNSYVRVRHGAKCIYPGVCHFVHVSLLVVSSMLFPLFMFLEMHFGVIRTHKLVCVMLFLYDMKCNIYEYIYKYIYICWYVYTDILFICLCTIRRICTYVRGYVIVYILYIHIDILTYIKMYTMYLYIYIYIYI